MKCVFEDLQDASIIHSISICYCEVHMLSAELNCSFESDEDTQSYLMNKKPSYLSWFKRVGLAGDCLKIKKKLYCIIVSACDSDKVYEKGLKAAMRKLRHMCVKDSVYDIVLYNDMHIDSTMLSFVITDIFTDTDISIHVCG